jgi:hypothetical protein
MVNGYEINTVDQNKQKQEDLNYVKYSSANINMWAH